MDEPTINPDASGKEHETLKLVGLGLCVLAASLGAISLVAGLHRLSLSQTCGCASVACWLANSLWRYRWFQVGGVAFAIVGVGAFFVRI